MVLQLAPTNPRWRTTAIFHLVKCQYFYTGWTYCHKVW